MTRQSIDLTWARLSDPDRTASQLVNWPLNNNYNVVASLPAVLLLFDYQLKKKTANQRKEFAVKWEGKIKNLIMFIGDEKYLYQCTIDQL